MIIPYEQIQHQLDCHEYAFELVAAYGGMPPNTSISYISSSFLDGLVNLLKHRRVFLINRYGVEDKDLDATKHAEILKHEENSLQRYQAVADFMESRPHLNLLDFDDALVFGETDNSFYFMWYDGDVSDCCIERVSKTLIPGMTLKQYVESTLANISTGYKNWAHTEMAVPFIIELKKVQGWLSS